VDGDDDHRRDRGVEPTVEHETERDLDRDPDLDLERDPDHERGRDLALSAISNATPAARGPVHRAYRRDGRAWARDAAAQATGLGPNG
jgi:hypothetical protein